MDSKQDVVFPTANSDTERAHNFQFYFKDKISKIRESFPPTTRFPTSASLPMSVRLLQAFEPVTEDEIHVIVLSYEVNCSPEDPIHANLLSDNMDRLVPYWAEL